MTLGSQALGKYLKILPTVSSLVMFFA